MGTHQIIVHPALIMLPDIGIVKNFTPTNLKGNSGIFKPRPYFWHEIRSSTHREQFGESRRPSEDI